MSICALHVVYYIIINILFCKAAACSECKWATVSTNSVIRNGNWHCACSSCTLCCTWACSKVSSHPVSNRKLNNNILGNSHDDRPFLPYLFDHAYRNQYSALCCVIWNLNKILYRAKYTFSGIVVWGTATLPYLVLTILLIRGLMLPGSLTGITYYLQPELYRLLDTQVTYINLNIYSGGIMFRRVL